MVDGDRSTGPPLRAPSAGRQPRRKQSLMASAWPPRRLVGVYPAPGRDEDRVGAQLRGPGLEDVGAALAAVARYRPHPLQQRGRAAKARAGRRQVGGASTRSPRLAFGAVTKTCAPPRRSHRGRPAQLPRDLSCTTPCLQHPLDRVPRSCLIGGRRGPQDRLAGPFSSFRTCRPPISRGRPIRPSGYRVLTFIRTCADECGRCSDEVDNQGRRLGCGGCPLVTNRKPGCVTMAR